MKTFNHNVKERAETDDPKTFDHHVKKDEKEAPMVHNIATVPHLHARNDESSKGIGCDAETERNGDYREGRQFAGSGLKGFEIRKVGGKGVKGRGSGAASRGANSGGGADPAEWIDTIVDTFH